MVEDSPDSPLMSTSKRRTAAELMNEKQEEYEKRVPREKNPVDRVHQHNSAYPKLIDELENRRSLANIRMGKHNQLACDARRFDPKCRACCRQKVLADLQKYDIRPRCETGDRKEAVEARKTTTRSNKTERIGRGICKRCREKQKAQQLRRLVAGSRDDVRCFLVNGKEAQFINKHCNQACKVNRNQVLRILDAQENRESQTDKKYKSDTNTCISSRNSDDSQRSFNTNESMSGEPMVEN